MSTWNRKARVECGKLQAAKDAPKRQVHCLKCDKPATVMRTYDAKNNRRFVVAKCHGQEVRLPFQDQPNVTLEAWGEPPPPLSAA